VLIFLADSRCTYRSVALISDLLTEIHLITQQVNQQASAREKTGIGFKLVKQSTFTFEKQLIFQF